MNKQILRIAIPSIVTNITVPLLGMVDLSIAGHIGSASVIGAISVGSLIFNMVYWLFNFLRMGSSGLTAQAYGRESGCDERGILRMSLLVAFSCGLAIFFLQRPIEFVAQFIIEPSDEVWSLAVSYFRVRVWAAPAVLALFALNGWFIGMQNSRFPLYIAVSQNILNIIFSAVLVFIFHLGIEGVALGTVLSQYFGLLLALVFVRKINFHPIESLNARLSVSVKAFFTINANIFLRMVCLIAVTTAFTSYGARQGNLLLAVNSLLIQLFILFSYFCDGFALSGEALVGKFIGANDGISKSLCIRRLFLWSFGVVALFTALFYIGGESILGLLTDDNEVIYSSRPYLQWVLLVPISGFAAFIWDGIYIGATASKYMLYTLVLGAFVFFVVWYLPLPLSSNHHLWLAFILYLATRSVFQSVMFDSVLKANRRSSQSADSNH